MADIDYQEFVEIAQELIAESGRAITVQKLSAVPADAAKPWKGPATPTVASSQATIGTFVELFSFVKLGLEVIDDEMLKRTDQVVLVAQTALDIQEFDLIVDGSITWRIEWARILKPGPLTLLYWFGVKR